MKKPTRKRRRKPPPPPPAREEDAEGTVITSPSLPDELILHILSLLPASSIVRFRCVCKHWCNELIKDSDLVKAHLNCSIAKHNLALLVSQPPMAKCTKKGKSLFSVNLSGSRIEGIKTIKNPFKSVNDLHFHSSCNGLVLMGNPWYEKEKENESSIMLWNPTTAEFRHIPNPVDTDWFARSSVIGECDYLYAYDYKIVRIRVLCNRRYGVPLPCCDCQIKVYTLGTNSWESIPYAFSYDSYLACVPQRTLTANGALYWIRAPNDTDIVSRVIVSFDFEDHVIKQVPLTPGLQESLVFDGRHEVLESRLGDFDGCLSVILGGFWTNAKPAEVSIWVMKEYGVRESWTKMYTITNHSMMLSIRYGKMLVWGSVHGIVVFLKDDSSLVLYDPKHGICRDMDIGGFCAEDYYNLGCMEAYMESLVSLNSGTYLGQKSRRGKQK